MRSSKDIRYTKEHKVTRERGRSSDAITREHKDGRVDVEIRPRTITLKAQVEVVET